MRWRNRMWDGGRLRWFELGVRCFLELFSVVFDAFISANNGNYYRYIDKLFPWEMIGVFLKESWMVTKKISFFEREKNNKIRLLYLS